jgi:hypothetical protein
MLNNIDTKWYLVIYYDENGNSIEATMFSQDEIVNYLEDSDFQNLEIDKKIGKIAPVDWKKEYGIDNYTIQEL